MRITRGNNRQLRRRSLTGCFGKRIPFNMKNTYTIKEAQQNIAGMVRVAERGALATITRHQKPVAYVLSPARLNELLETLEIVSDSKAMKAIRDAETRHGKVYDAKDLPE